jgi:hypothetical protein
MEENKTPSAVAGHPAGCQCQNCKCCGMHGMCCHGRRFFLLRWLLGLFILAIVFCLGFKLGEFKGSFGYGYVPGFHQNRSMMKWNQKYYPYMMNQIPNMMRATTTPAK